MAPLRQPILIAAVVVLLLTGWAAQALAQSRIDGLWIDFNSIAWPQSYQEWREVHPAADCHSPHSDATWEIASGQWAARCTTRNGDALESEWSFYAFDLIEPIAAYLRQFRGYVRETDTVKSQQDYRKLAARLADRFGKAAQPAGVEEFGSAYWRDVLRWNTVDSEIYLYRSVETDEAQRLGLLARHRGLLDALAEDDQLNRSPWDYDGALRLDLDRQLVKELAVEFPDLERVLSLLESGVHSNDELSKHPEISDAVVSLLQAEQTAAAGRQPAILLAADELASHLGAGERVSPPWEKQRMQLSKYGLSYHWSELGAAWVYQHDLLQRVWKEFPNSAWGEWAFLQLLGSGWDTSGGCAEGSDQFRSVIEQAELFLKDHPASLHRPQILLALAQAYETWWSLSQASPEKDGCANPRQYQAGASQARDKAISYYEKIIRAQPASPEATRARRELPRLKLGIDTNQRGFFCIYD